MNTCSNIQHFICDDIFPYIFNRIQISSILKTRIARHVFFTIFDSFFVVVRNKKFHELRKVIQQMYCWHIFPTMTIFTGKIINVGMPI